jgi:hypothetical protein
MEQAITNFDSIDKFARKMNPDSDGLGFREMFNQLLDAATRHDKVAKDTAANQQRKIQQAKATAAGGSKGNKGSDKGKTTNGEGCWRYYSPEDWTKLPSDKKKGILEQRKKTPKPARKINAGQQSTTTGVNDGGSQATVPRTVHANAAQVDNQSVVTSTTAPETPGSAIRTMLSNAASRRLDQDGSNSTIMVHEGRAYLRLNMAKRTYHVKSYLSTEEPALNEEGDLYPPDKGPLGSLIDGGANGGLCGSDVEILEYTLQHCDVVGIAQNTVTNLPIVQCAGKTHTMDGDDVILIFNQYASKGDGHTIHSCSQLRHFGSVVDDVPRAVGGHQRIITPCGKHIPLAVRDGLCHMALSKPTRADLEKLPKIIMTSDVPWDPRILDTDLFDEHEETREAQQEYHLDPDFDDGDVDHEVMVEYCVRHAFEAMVKRHIPRYDKLRPYLGYIPVERVKKTFENTTQWYRASTRLPFRHHFKSRFPAANVRRLNEMVATDTFFSDTPAADDGLLDHGGVTMVQVYVGRDSLLTRTFPMQQESDMHKTLQDFIRYEGAPTALKSDNALTQIGTKTREILRLYNIRDFRCEPHNQQQNPAKRRIQDMKNMSTMIMDATGTPPEYWLLNILYVTHVLNHTAHESLKWKTPIEVSRGELPDISPFLAFHWWETVYFEAPPSKDRYPSGDRELLGRWVGIADNVGDILTYWILSESTRRVIARSNVRKARGSVNPNLNATRNAQCPGGETLMPVDDVAAIVDSMFTEAESVRSPAAASVLNPRWFDFEDLMDTYDDDSTPNLKRTRPFYNASDIAGVPTHDLPTFTPDDLLNRKLIYDIEGERYNATVVRKLIDRDSENHRNLKFLLEIGEGNFDAIITYNELCDLIEKQEEQQESKDPDTLWTYDDILGHQGPLKPNDPFYKGSSYNVLVKWSNGEESYEPLYFLIKDDPIFLARYARDHGLLSTPGWKSLNKYVRQIKAFGRMTNQAKLNFESNGARYKFGVQVPKTWHDAMRLDATYKNDLWQVAIQSEMDQILRYDTFEDIGLDTPAPPGYKRITAHLVFDVKHDLRRKARFVAGGHLTDPPKDSVYSGVVSLRSLRLVAMLAELNGLELWAADVGNAYLEASTKEKVYIIAGPEFGEHRKGHTMLIKKALYGLRTSGARWHEHFADTLRNLGFAPSKADSDVWMRDCSDYYEYVCVYVDDLAIAMRDPKAFTDALIEQFGYTLKGVGPMSYHLGADIYRDQDGTLCFGAKSYIERMLINYETMFGEKPKEYSSPMDKNDHPELDTTSDLSKDDIKKYQSLIGALQWVISLCRFDIHCAVMTMGRFRSAPHHGHLERVQRICGYLRKRPDGAVRLRINIPDNLHTAPGDHNWDTTVYGNVIEELPHDMPTPKGKPVRMTTFEDANLLHDHVTGRSAMGILHFVNQTPVEWFSKRQNTVETATYGSEFVVAKTATEQIIDLRYTLRMLGVPLDGKSWMFGDNESVVKSSTIPQSNLMKRHNALAYHRVREAIAAGVIEFLHIPGIQNPADVLTKFLPYTTMWPLIEPILFWKGETQLKITRAIKQDALGVFLSSDERRTLLAEGSNTDKPKPRIKYLWEPQEYETDEIADMFDTPEGIRTLREFAINGIYLESSRRDYDIPDDY